MSGIERFMNQVKVEEVDATITIREVVEAAVAIKEDEAVVVIKEAVEEAEEMDEAEATKVGVEATKVGAEATITPTIKETKTKAKMGDTITITPKVGVTTTITGKEMRVIVKTGPERSNVRATRDTRTRIWAQGAKTAVDWTLHHPADTSILQEEVGATETPSPRAPQDHTIK